MNQHIVRDEKATSFLVSNIRTFLDVTHDEVCALAKKKMRALHIAPQNAKYSIYRKSIDARKKHEIYLVWTVMVTAPFHKNDIEKLTKAGFSQAISDDIRVVIGEDQLLQRPLVVGTGPAGLFCSYMLAEYGYRPMVIERGGSVDERVAKVERFVRDKILDCDTNIQFGAGGAGTFSDGKLLTRTNDPFIPYILKTFVRHGAPEEILLQAKPHIGTDILRQVVKNMIATIENNGGKIIFNTKLTDVIESTAHGGIAQTNKSTIPFGVMVLATGHSARDTYNMLIQRGFNVIAKPFSVGTRIEHLQKDIDEALYGKFAGHPALGHGEYALSCNTDTRGVYTFCMCPGGVVVPAASEEETVVVNGMSYHSRNGQNANSAVVVSIRPEDYGNTPQKAIAFQREIEKNAYIAGGSNYAAPLITVEDYMKEVCCTMPTRVLPTYMDGNHYALASPDKYLPSFVNTSLRDALTQFERKIKGFSALDAIITGPETRTSAPVRVIRAEDKTAIGHPAIYPCGEGAGYAGGITSAAADGLRCATAIIEKYRPFN